MFTKLLKSVFDTLRGQGHIILAYIDDFILLGNTKDECVKNVNETLTLTNRLGFIHHPVKSVLQPCQKITFLWFTIDSVAMTVTFTSMSRPE